MAEKEEAKQQDLGMTQTILGSIILKIQLPMELIDEINKAYDDNAKNLEAHNKHLAGKIKE
jgi:hypothetical protein